MSKTYGLAGLRIGWIATRNQDIYQAMATFKDFTSICNSAPSEFLSTLALCHRDQIVQRNRGIIAANTEVCDQFFSNHTDRFNWSPPKGGSTAFPSLTQATGAEEFCLNLVQQTGVLLIPSTYFDYGDKNFRIGLGRKDVPEYVAKLDNFLKNN